MASTILATDVAAPVEFLVIRSQLGTDHRRRLRCLDPDVHPDASRVRPRAHDGVSMVQRERQRHDLRRVHRDLAGHRAMAVIGPRAAI